MKLVCVLMITSLVVKASAELQQTSNTFYLFKNCCLIRSDGTTWCCLLLVILQGCHHGFGVVLMVQLEGDSRKSLDIYMTRFRGFSSKFLMLCHILKMMRFTMSNLWSIVFHCGSIHIFWISHRCNTLSFNKIFFLPIQKNKNRLDTWTSYRCFFLVDQ